MPILFICRMLQLCKHSVDVNATILEGVVDGGRCLLLMHTYMCVCEGVCECGCMHDACMHTLLTLDEGCGLANAGGEGNGCDCVSGCGLANAGGEGNGCDCVSGCGLENASGEGDGGEGDGCDCVTG